MTQNKIPIERLDHYTIEPFESENTPSDLPDIANSIAGNFLISKKITRVSGDTFIVDAYLNTESGTPNKCCYIGIIYYKKDSRSKELSYVWARDDTQTNIWESVIPCTLINGTDADLKDKYHIPGVFEVTKNTSTNFIINISKYGYGLAGNKRNICDIQTFGSCSYEQVTEYTAPSGSA